MRGKLVQEVAPAVWGDRGRRGDMVMAAHFDPIRHWIPGGGSVTVSAYISGPASCELRGRGDGSRAIQPRRSRNPRGPQPIRKGTASNGFSTHRSSPPKPRRNPMDATGEAMTEAEWQDTIQQADDMRNAVAALRKVQESRFLIDGERLAVTHLARLLDAAVPPVPTVGKEA